MDIAAAKYYFMNRNSLGALFGCTIPMAMSLSFTTSIRWQKIVYLLASGGMALGTILTYSRSALLGMITGIGVLFWISRQHRRFLAIIIILSAMFIGWRVSDKFFNRIETIENYQEDASAMGRIATNYAALAMVRTHPFLGIGPGNFPDRVLEFTPSQYSYWVAEGKQIHNIILQAFAENGIVGGAFFLALITFVLMCGTRHALISSKNGISSLSGGIIASYWGYLAFAQFGQGAYYGALFHLMPLVIVVGLNDHDRLSEESIWQL